MPDTHGLIAPISAAEITDEIWLEVARHHAGAAPMRKAAEQARLASSPVAVPAAVPAPLPLPALLGLDGAAFIDAAYATVLGRLADEAGTAHLGAELSRGRSKIELLGELQASDEGRLSGREIQGLRRRYLARRFYRVPVIGPLARIATGALRRLGVSRAFGARDRPDVALRAELESRLGSFEAALDSRRRALEERLAEQQVALELSTRRLAAVQAAQEELGRRTLAAMAEQGRLLASLSGQNAGFARQLVALEDSVIDTMLAMSDSLGGHETRLERVEARVGAVEGKVDPADAAARIDAAAGALRAELDGRLIAAETVAEQSRQIAADQQRRIGLILHAVRHPLPPAAEAQDDHAFDELYLQFEDRFRGTRDSVRERQRAYLPRLREAGAGTPARPVLDLGAGRGEFLELLREEGLAARGVDASGAMVAQCRAAGLDCTEADALSHLAAQPDGSLGAVTGFHIIEHLPFKVMVRIMDEALRALAPGGLLVLETPNPANLLTASRYFHLDPTHRNPLPFETVAMVAEARGFPDPLILQLHPMTARFPGTDRQLAGALDQIFHGPQDYALVVRRPPS